MGAKKKNERQTPEDSDAFQGASQGGVRAGRDIQAGRDIAGRDIFTYTYSSSLLETLAAWQTEMTARIESQVDLTPDEKQDLKQQVEKIREEAEKGEKADPKRLEKLINALAAWSYDIFEVAIATLANPLAGLGLALKKISDRARLETAKGS